MSTEQAADVLDADSVDERLAYRGPVQRLLTRPEIGALVGTAVIWVYFWSVSEVFGTAAGTANYLDVSATLGIMAVAVSMLMIGGEFDLSAGAMTGATGILVILLVIPPGEFGGAGLSLWIAIPVVLAFALSIGWFNGTVVERTGLPSFIVTLAFLYILRGLTIFAAIATTHKTIIGGMREAAEGDWLAPLFGGKILTGLFQWMGDNGWIDTFQRGLKQGQPVVEGVPMLIVWGIGLIIFGQVLLTKTRFGNWIFASGGDAQAARYVGVPVNRVKILMFMFTAFTATVFATAQVMEFGSAAADRGLLKEFEAIISVVIGGTLLTGGYGSVIGAALGALIFGVVQQGLFFAQVESSLFRVFLGTILILADRKSTRLNSSHTDISRMPSSA